MDYLEESYRDELNSTGKIQEEGRIVCPHCFRDEELDEETLKEEPHIEKEMKCTACGKTFDVKMFVYRSYYARTKKTRKEK